MKALFKSSLIAALAMSAGVADAQTSTNRLDVKTAWHVFAEPAAPSTPTECWSVAVPKETVNTDSNGQIRAVNRGEILMFVTYTRGSSAPVVSFTGGYPFADSSFVNVKIGESTFEFFTEGEYAWPATSGDDSKVIAAMKRGAEAVLTARSSRGTITKDTFSLYGFTAAMESAENYCTG